MAPKLSVKLHELGVAQASDELNQLITEHVVPLYALRTKRKGYEVSAMKTMLNMIGLRGGVVRPPLVEVAEAEQEELKRILEGWRRAGFLDR